jgi:hypothetical protein
MRGFMQTPQEQLATLAIIYVFTGAERYGFDPLSGAEACRRGDEMHSPESG